MKSGVINQVISSFRMAHTNKHGQAAVVPGGYGGSIRLARKEPESY